MFGNVRDDGGVMCRGCELNVGKLDSWSGENGNKGNFLSDDEWGDECCYVVCDHRVKGVGSLGGDGECKGDESCN